jgi:Ca2+-binding EF-hand superfamily protein
MTAHLTPEEIAEFREIFNLVDKVQCMRNLPYNFLRGISRADRSICVCRMVVDLYRRMSSQSSWIP